MSPTTALLPRRRTRALCAVALLALAGPPPHAAADPPARKGPVPPVSGGSFPRRHEQYVALVANGSERALDQLILAYRRRDLEPAEKGRIVSLACDGFPGADRTAPLAEWREKDDSEGDAWLWYRTLLREIGAAGPAGAYAAARDARRPVVLRAAALRALATWADEGLPAFVTEAAGGDLGKPPARETWVEALAEALASQPGRVGAPEIRAAVGALLPMLREDAVAPRTRLQVARGLARLLGLTRPTYDASYLEALLDRLEAPPRPQDDRYASPRFFGVEGTGDRVVYVVDLSGSMDSRLSEEEMADLRRAAGSARSAGEADPLAAIPFDRIRTRRDAAVEFTKASIRGLRETAWFGILFFSDAAAWAGGATELQPATKANVASAVKALERTRMGWATNLHGGLRRAFETLIPVPGKRLHFAGSTGSAEALVRAPTTIFLLSDGAPTWDDWGFGGRVKPAPPTAPLAPVTVDPVATEPYEETESLVDDVARMNLLRGCEIHAIGIGEFDRRLLDRLAHAGRGTVRRIGPALGGAGRAAGPSARELVEIYRRLKMSVPGYLLKQAAEEEKRAREEKRKAADAPPAPDAPVPAPAGPTSPEEDLSRLANDPSPATRRAAADRLRERQHALAIPALARALAEDPDPDVHRACDTALRRLAGRGFGDEPSLLTRAERVAVRRNWDWWWGLHHERVEAEAAARRAAENPAPPAPSRPPTPPGTGGDPTPR